MMMRKLVLLTTVFAAGSLTAATAPDQKTLQSYAARAFTRCPGSTISVEPVVNEPSPVNFMVYRVTQKSTDQTCGSQRYLIYSPTTKQTVFGSAVKLAFDPRSLQTRIAEQVGPILKSDVKVVISPFPLPDGLHAVTITRETPYGSFAYKGYADASERFMLVGLRGNLSEDPTRTLRDALELDSAARRGNSGAKLEIIELSDFQCPTCGRAHEALEPLFSKNLNKINFVRLDLPLFEHHQWALPAALGARAIQRIAPGKYWRYVDQVFKNQDKLDEQKFEGFLRNFVEDNDIDWPSIERIIHSDAERQALLDQVSRAFSAGINSTPTFLINGQVIGYGDGKLARELITKAIASVSAPGPAKKTAAKKTATRK